MPVVSHITRLRRTLFIRAASLAIVAGVTGATAVAGVTGAPNIDSNTGDQPTGESASIVADAGERLPGYPFPSISSVSR